MNIDSTSGKMKGRFQFAEHPWISLLVLNLLILFLIILAGRLGLSDVNFLFYHVLMLFIIVPFVLRLPKGRRSFKDYLDDIRLSRVQPLFPLLLLGFSCYFIMLFCQATGSCIRTNPWSVYHWFLPLVCLRHHSRTTAKLLEPRYLHALDV